MTDYKKHTYTDPTGGGDDATVELPIWAQPVKLLPATITTVDQEAQEAIESDNPDEVRPAQEEIVTTQVVYFELEKDEEE